MIYFSLFLLEATLSIGIGGIESTDSLDVEIYHRVIGDFILEEYNWQSERVEIPILVFLDSALYLDLSQDNTSRFEYLRDKYTKLKYSTFSDFLLKNRSPLKVERIEETYDRAIIIDGSSIPLKDTLFNQYPNWNGWIIELSNVGFNVEGNQALVYFGFEGGLGVGGGVWLIYHKKFKKWKLKRIIPAWGG